MQKYEFSIDDGEAKVITSIEEIEQDLEELNNMQASEENDRHLFFKPMPPFCDVIEFSVSKSAETKGFFKKRLLQNYYFEINFKYPDGTAGLSCKIGFEFNEVKEILTNLINYQQLPNTNEPDWSIVKFDADGNV